MSDNGSTDSNDKTEAAKPAKKAARRKTAVRKKPAAKDAKASPEQEAAPEQPVTKAEPKRAKRRRSAEKTGPKPGATTAGEAAGAKPDAGAASGPAATPAAPTPAAAPADLIRVPMPVRWRDLDAFNHVNNSKYLSYLEEARLQWMLTAPGMGMDDHVAPVVAAAQLNYRRPIAWPAQVVIELFVERLGNTSLTVGHRIVDGEDGQALFCDGHVVMVWIDRDSGAAAPLPEAVRVACGGVSGG